MPTLTVKAIHLEETFQFLYERGYETYPVLKRETLLANKEEIFRGYGPQEFFLFQLDMEDGGAFVIGGSGDSDDATLWASYYNADDHPLFEKEYFHDIKTASNLHQLATDLLKEKGFELINLEDFAESTGLYGTEKQQTSLKSKATPVVVSESDLPF